VVAEPPRRALEVARTAIGAESVQLFGDRLHVRVSAAAEAEPVRQALASAGVAVSSWRTIKPTLEDVFIERLAQAPARVAPDPTERV
jgi:ABC-2 type transport system ATP-binding protein